MTRRLTSFGALLLAAAALAVLFAAVAPAANKPFTVNLSPSSIASGGPATITATFKNTTPNQAIGSANLTAPAAIHVSGAQIQGSGDASVSGQTVMLRNVTIAPNGTLSVAISVTSDATCGSQTVAWTVQAKQSNDFNGTGNDFTLDAANSALSTTLTGTCGLRFAVQPSNSQVSRPISPAVKVEVVDGNGQRVTSATTPITLSLASNPSGATLGGTLTKAAQSGVATFSDLTVDEVANGYTLKATGGSASATSSAFNVDQLAVGCPEDQTCDGTLSSSTTNVTVTAFPDPALPDVAILSMSLNAGSPFACTTASNKSGDRFGFFVSSANRRKQIDYTLGRELGLTGIQLPSAGFCFAAPYTFPVKPGTTLAQSGGEYIGQLPDCPSAGPCIVSRQQSLIGDILLRISVPPNDADPRGFGFACLLGC